MTKQQDTTMIVITIAMTPSARSSVPTEIPILAPLEDDIVHGSSDNARAPIQDYLVTWPQC